MSRLFASRFSAKSLEGRPQNSINGSDAESFAMAKVLLACRGEGQWGSREEDNSKIDMIFSTAHPWCSGERLMILCQGKSGKAYGKSRPDGAFTLKRPAKESAKRTNHAICVVWVDRSADSTYWAYIHPNSRLGNQIYGRNHQVNPAMIFDLARCAAGSSGSRGGGRGVRLPSADTDFKSHRAEALKSYRSSKQILSPVLGNIELTKFGWRHMFRKSRAADNKSASLTIIPRLPAILSQHPSTMAITATYFTKRSDFEVRTCEYLLKFNEVQLQNMNGYFQKTSVHIRVLEEIFYPLNWEQKAMLSQTVKRRVVLKSAYYK